jgi:MYXO-CTERM domain-containing protein
MKADRLAASLAASLAWALALTLALPTLAEANVPASFLACEGAADGEPCSMPGPFYGNCVRDTLCTDNPATDPDECLLCVDPCWAALPAGSYCVRFDGRDGICEPQSMCTPDPAKSFAQCNRCVEGDIARTDPESGGCAAAVSSGDTLVAGAAWLMLLLVGAGQFRRRRRGHNPR